MRTKKRGILLKLLVVALVVYVAVEIISLRIRIAEKQRQLFELQYNIEEQTAENVSLSREIDAEFTEEQIKKIARERLGLVSIDEEIYISITGE